MGMSIDEHIAQLKKLKSFHNGSYGASINLAISIMRKYPLMQSKYDKRLKADMVAMLEEIRIKADELQGYVHNSDFWDGVYTYDGIIEAKINNLKGEEDGKYND